MEDQHRVSSPFSASLLSLTGLVPCCFPQPPYLFFLTHGTLVNFLPTFLSFPSGFPFFNIEISLPGTFALLCVQTVSRKLHMLSRFSCVQLCATLWNVAPQAPPSMGFSGQEYWSGLPCPPPGDLPDAGMEPGSPKLQADLHRLSLQGSHHLLYILGLKDTAAVEAESPHPHGACLWWGCQGPSTEGLRSPSIHTRGDRGRRDRATAHPRE